MERKVWYFIVVGIILLFGGTISAAADVTVTKVWPDKLRYDFEAPGKITITLKNASQVLKHAGKLTLTLHSALDREETLYDETVELAAGETKAIDVPFATGSKADGAEYGYEARAVWSVDGKPVSSAREFFMITDSPLKIGHLTIPTAATDHRHGWWGSSVARWRSEVAGRLGMESAGTLLLDILEQENKRPPHPNLTHGWVRSKMGKFAFMHSDGHITEIYPDLVEIGIDAVNSQLACMDIDELARIAKGKLTFWGEIDRQHVLCADDPDVARREVRRIAQALYDPSGGIIAQFEFGAGARPATAAAVFDEWDSISGR